MISFEIVQHEGDFASLTIHVKNPRVGLLSANLWATLSDTTGTLFYGRLVGVPEDLHENAVSLTFLARPDTYDADKAALAESLKVAPYWDPVWIAPDMREDPDSVLEARPQLWHIDRVTHAVTVSDIVQGEAGTVVIDPNTVPYDGLSITYGDTPAELITCRAEVHWRQKAGGQFDLTARLMEAFTAAATTEGGYIVTFSGLGLFDDWPEAGQNIGKGWSVSNATVARNDELTTVLAVEMATGGFNSPESTVNPFGGPYIYPRVYPNIVYGGGLEDWGDASNVSNETYTSTISHYYSLTGQSFKRPNYYDDGPGDRGGPSVAGFPKWRITGTLAVQYDADRERVEVLEFTIGADVQPLVSARQDANISVEMTTSEVDQPIDEGGQMPIGDVRRNSYLLTTRGQRSIEYLICLCRARLLARARAVEISFTTTLEAGRALTLRHSVSISDPRLPGGIAIGKVVGLSLSMDGDSGEARANVTMACTIGRGNTLTVTAPTGVLFDAAIAEAGIQAVIGGETLVASDIAYTPVDTTPIEGGEGALFSLTAESAVESITVTNGVNDQTSLLLSKTWQDTNEAIEALKEIPTTVEVNLVPVTGDPIVTPFPIMVSDLMVPRTIDLEAA